jgi:hypothetical protein
MIVKQLLEWMCGKGNRSTRRKPSPVPLRKLKIPHELTRTRTRVVAVGSRRLTARATALPEWWLRVCFVFCGTVSYLHNFTHRGMLLAQAEVSVDMPTVSAVNCIVSVLMAPFYTHREQYHKAIMSFALISFKIAPRVISLQFLQADTPSPSAFRFTVPLCRQQVPTDRGARKPRKWPLACAPVSYLAWDTAVLSETVSWET